MSESTLTLVPTPETWDREAPDRRHLADPVVDPFGLEHARELAAHRGPWLSFTLPTHRHGPQTKALPLEVRGLLDQVAETDHRLPEAVVDPVVALVEDPFFQQHQADALAVFSAQGLLRFHRLSSSVASLEPRVRWGRASLLPLVPWLVDPSPFHLVALSRGQVRVFRGSRNTWESLDVPDLPESLEDFDEHFDGERQMQWSPQGGGNRTVHGHGGDSSARWARVEQFIGEVSARLRSELEPGIPLILACVPQNAAAFRASGGHPDLLDDLVEGNADRMTGFELHAAGLALAEQQRDAATERDRARVEDLLGSGRVGTVPESVVRDAGQGRVERLWVRGDATEAELHHLDLAVLMTLDTSGHVGLLPKDSPHAVLAELRW